MESSNARTKKNLILTAFRGSEDFRHGVTSYLLGYEIVSLVYAIHIGWTKKDKQRATDPLRNIFKEPQKVQALLDENFTVVLLCSDVRLLHQDIKCMYRYITNEFHSFIRLHTALLLLYDAVDAKPEYRCKPIDLLQRLDLDESMTCIDPTIPLHSVGLDEDYDHAGLLHWGLTRFILYESLYRFGVSYLVINKYGTNTGYSEIVYVPKGSVLDPKPNNVVVTVDLSLVPVHKYSREYISNLSSYNTSDNRGGIYIPIHTDTETDSVTIVS